MLPILRVTINGNTRPYLKIGEPYCHSCQICGTFGSSSQKIYMITRIFLRRLRIPQFFSSAIRLQIRCFRRTCALWCQNLAPEKEREIERWMTKGMSERKKRASYRANERENSMKDRTNGGGKKERMIDQGTKRRRRTNKRSAWQAEKGKCESARQRTKNKSAHAREKSKTNTIKRTEGKDFFFHSKRMKIASCAGWGKHCCLIVAVRKNIYLCHITKDEV